MILSLMKIRLCFFLLFGCWLASAAAVRAEVKTVGEVTVALIAEVEQVVPGQTFYAALDFKLEPHWHLYWKNPGASGLPVEVEWQLPQGFSAGEIEWPTPERIEVAGLMNYGYEDAVTLLVPIHVPDTLQLGTPVALQAEVFWLVCKEMCLPGEASLRLELPVALQSAPGAQADVFAAARARLPRSALPWSLAASVEGPQLVLTLAPSDGAAVPVDLYVYASAAGVIDPSAVQTLTVDGDGGARLQLALDAAQLDQPLESFDGVLQSGSDSWAFELGIGESVEVRAVAALNDSVPAASGFEGVLLRVGLPGWLLLAFLGGLILNVMPCVLPVLSLKVFSLLKHSGQTRGQALLHGAAYTLGVVASFLVLAGFLFALRALGERIGWGFQLQSPNFVVVLTVVFFLFGLNLMGVFEIGTRLVGADAKVSQRNDVLGSFGMGVLAAVVGAPCMGPLVASVSGIAVQSNVATGLLIFGVMGLGLASPFLLLSIFPKLVAYLPKPGVWMESIKQFMGFLLMAAVVFLAWVAGRQGGVHAVIAILIALLLCGLAAWVYGRWSVPVKPVRTRRIAQLISLLLLVSATLYAVGQTKAAYLYYQAGAAPAADGQWSAWSAARVTAELAAGNPVFIDFTASWCLICQANKKLALRTDSTAALFQQYGVVALQADWTRYDAAITAELERFGRSGVPLYVLYAPDGEVSVLPQSLTNGIVRDAVEKTLK